MTRVAIMQPTYLPWLGYFDLIDRVDVFVLLDTVQFAKRSWQSRNRIRTSKPDLEFLSVPTRNGGRRHQTIAEVELVDGRFVANHLATLRHAYARAPFFGVMVDPFEAVLARGAETGRLCDLNAVLIAWFADRLGIATRVIRASEFDVDGKRSDLLSAIAGLLGASVYVSPPGSLGYLVDERAAFETRGIAIAVQVFEHPTYVQSRPGFLSHATVLDALFEVGPDETSRLIQSGRRPEQPLDVWIATHPEAREAS